MTDLEVGPQDVLGSKHFLSVLTLLLKKTRRKSVFMNIHYVNVHPITFELQISVK
jgi:hypothetical protein